MSHPLDKIDHIVVLMLENRSFDNMLGFLYTPEEAPDFDGATGQNLSNPIPPKPTARKTAPSRIASVSLTPIPTPTPAKNTLTSTANSSTSQAIPPPPQSLPDPPMTGFVRDYIETFKRERGRPPTYNEYAIIMNGFAPETVPVLSALAKNYAVCDRWFCSVPTQTLPNRAFVAAATSDGHLLNEPYPRWVFDRSPTIFDRLETAGLPWKIYHDPLDILSLTWLMQPSLWPHRHKHVADLDQFYLDVKNDALPHYAFLEPRLLVDHNDQHPPISDVVVTSSVLAGEQLIHEVYKAIRNGPAWEKTLLIITYDEHGGCYDHVSPPVYPACPQAVPPDDKPGEFDFLFDRLGPRVPAVLISAYTKPGMILHTIYDHTSIIKTITARWHLPSLTRREAAAHDLGDALPLTEPRKDFPEITPRPYQPTDADQVPNEPLNHLQKAVLALSAAVQQFDRIREDQSVLQKITDLERLVKEETEVTRIKTTGEAVKFMAEILIPTTNMPKPSGKTQQGCLGWLLAKLGLCA
ncbi:MAG: phosphoesterase [Anaerolineales bacterium]|nr:phosphoesterase [Anaerolineales bacterium]